MLKKVVRSLKKFVKEEEAQGMTEYGLVLALIVVIVIGAVGILGGGITAKFTAIKDSLMGTSTPTQ
jgi:pilus assembly protein Flp/PilA